MSHKLLRYTIPNGSDLSLKKLLVPIAPCSTVLLDNGATGTTAGANNEDWLFDKPTVIEVEQNKILTTLTGDAALKHRKF